jgi:hypothetical protein
VFDAMDVQGVRFDVQGAVSKNSPTPFSDVRTAQDTAQLLTDASHRPELGQIQSSRF